MVLVGLVLILIAVKGLFLYLKSLKVIDELW